MKKTLFLTFIIALLSLLSFQSVKADFSERIQIEEAPTRRNIIIIHPHTDERYLLHLKTGCGKLEPGQTVNLVVKGSLNSNQDFIKVDELHRCAIDQAERFDEKLYVNYVFRGNTEAIVTDEAGQKYFMQYGAFCRALRRYFKQYIYVVHGGETLAESDKIYLPNKDGQCSAGHVRKRRMIKRKKPAELLKDTQVPTTVTHVRALPGNGEVFLNWRKAQDNRQISHYLLSYSPFKIDPKDVPVNEMPNQTRLETNQHTVTGLNNNETYFFYVLAVDTSGNLSSDWSRVVRGIPRASILSVERKPSGDLFLNLKLFHESRRSFLFVWDPPSDTQRQTVIFEADGQREFARTDYKRKRIRILKRPHRKGKTLRLTVRVYDIISLKIEEKLTFEF